MMKKYAAMLSKKSQKKWSKFIEKLDTEHEVHTQQPTEYNRNNVNLSFLIIFLENISNSNL